MAFVGLMMRGAAVVALALSLSACAGSGDKTPPAEKTAAQLYSEAEAIYREGDNVEAAKRFDLVERYHPYSGEAKQAMLMTAVAHFDAGEYDQAIVSAERYVEFFPSDDQTAYARYLIAEASFERITDVGREQSVTLAALDAYRQVIALHPDTKYAREAKIKYDLALDQLAGKEMEVGRYYLKRQQYQAAIGRFRTVVEQYQTTTHIEEALLRLTECYLALGVVDEATAAAAVLGHNFPGSTWYQDAYALLEGNGLRPDGQNKSWLGDVYRRVIKGEWL